MPSTNLLPDRPSPTDGPVIMLVAQAPFEAGFDQFCKLVPLVYTDGTRAVAGDFPNDGEIWWLLLPQTSQLAEPGRLLVGRLELAKQHKPHDPNSSRYQIVLNTIRELTLNDGFEFIELPGDALDSIQDVVSAGFRLELPVPPCSAVMLQWRSTVYGPFLATPEKPGSPQAAPSYAFSPLDTANMTVYQIGQDKFTKVVNPFRLVVDEGISLNTHRRGDSFYPFRVRRVVVLKPGYEGMLAAVNPQKLVVEPVDRKLMRFAKDCLSRSKRQQFAQLLEELEIKGRGTQEAEELLEAVGRMKIVTGRQEAALDSVTNALLRSGLLGEDRISKAEKTFAEKYVQDRTAEMQTRIDRSLSDTRAELVQFETRLKEQRTAFQKEESRQRANLGRELTAEREAARAELDAARREFEKKEAELTRQQTALQQNLEKVTKDLREAGDEVVNRFLTIAPLLGAFGSVGGPAPAGGSPPSPTTERETAPPAPTFALPTFVTAPAVRDGELGEEAFFDRFCRVVEDSGFAYRPLDLQRFHLSVKCGEITVLGGPSGTGKSSLPALYARALMGDEVSGGRPGCLMVNVNPSWMDARDLLGHMNTLEGQFYPAESGLFQHLVCAQEEHRTRGTATGLYLACLDEMNLSQVEHYFGDLMMVLERRGVARTIQCFSPDSAGSKSPFRDWGVIALSPALRFVGTVNFDETTRTLSDRFLDRVNQIRLEPAGLPGAPEAGDGTFATATGRMVTLADLESWQRDSALPPELALLLDLIRPLLNTMGCAISPRVYRGVCRFVASSEPIMTPAKSFDVQVAQRIVPKVRSLIGKRQLDALDELMRTLNQTTACDFKETLSLLESVRDQAGQRGGWNLED